MFLQSCNMGTQQQDLSPHIQTDSQVTQILLLLLFKPSILAFPQSLQDTFLHPKGEL